VELKKGFQGLEQPVFLMEILLPDPFLKTRYGLASESEGTGIEILYRFGKQEDTGYRFCDFFPYGVCLKPLRRELQYRLCGIPLYKNTILYF
jgi:hypothetical protein